jgi:molybdopterin molybdotransferase
MSVLTFTEARRIVEQHARRQQPIATETVPLLESHRRVLAAEIAADRDFPPFQRATRDGYAVRAADLNSGPVRLEVIGEIRAGASLAALACNLHPGEAIEIMTGAPMPSGADAVLMVEHAAREGRFMIPGRAVVSGENVVPQGAEAHAGERLLTSGTRLDPAAIAVAASCGHAEIPVYVRPQVAILATGDELVEIDAQPGAGQIRNSNSYSLAAQVAEAGANPLILPPAPDEASALREAIIEALAADLLLLTGGVSMGKYDLVEQVLAQFQAEFYFTGALIQPGKPVVFGRLPRQEGVAGPAKLFFGLPGNPLATMVTFELFVRPVIDALAGAAVRPLRFLQALLKSELRSKTGLTRFLPAMLSGEFERAEVEAVRWQGSGDVVAQSRADCYLVVPPDRECISAGEMVSVLLH